VANFPEERPDSVAAFDKPELEAEALAEALAEADAAAVPRIQTGRWCLR